MSKYHQKRRNDMVTQYEVISALELIQQVCKEAEECMNCPLRFAGNTKSCLVEKSIPLDWEINKLRGWRAFK